MCLHTFLLCLLIISQDINPHGGLIIIWNMFSHLLRYIFHSLMNMHVKVPSALVGRQSVCQKVMYTKTVSKYRFPFVKYIVDVKCDHTSMPPLSICTKRITWYSPKLVLNAGGSPIKANTTMCIIRSNVSDKHETWNRLHTPGRKRKGIHKTSNNECRHLPRKEWTMFSLISPFVDIWSLFLSLGSNRTTSSIVVIENAKVTLIYYTQTKK